MVEISFEFKKSDSTEKNVRFIIKKKNEYTRFKDVTLNVNDNDAYKLALGIAQFINATYDEGRHGIGFETIQD